MTGEIKKRNDLSLPGRSKCLIMDDDYIYYSKESGGSTSVYYISILDFIGDNAETLVGTRSPNTGYTSIYTMKLDKLDNMDILIGSMLQYSDTDIDELFCYWKNVHTSPTRQDGVTGYWEYEGMVGWTGANDYCYYIGSSSAGDHGVVRDRRYVNTSDYASKSGGTGGFGNWHDVACSNRYIHGIDLRVGGVGPSGIYGIYDVTKWDDAWEDFELYYASISGRSGIIYDSVNDKFISWGYNNRRIYIADPTSSNPDAVYFDTPSSEGNVTDVRSYGGYLYIGTTTNGKVLVYDISGNKKGEYDTGVASPITAVAANASYVCAVCSGWMYLWKIAGVPVSVNMSFPLGGLKSRSIISFARGVSI